MSARGAASLPGGLRLLPAERGAAAIAAVAAIVEVTAFVVLLDGVVFRDALPADYVAFHARPLWPRVIEACLAAMADEVVYRLGLTTLLVAAIAWWRGSVAPWQVVAAIAAAQLVNVWALVLAAPAYGALRFWAVGCVWGWLYWRHGWVAALAGHGAVHLALDPVLAVVLVG